MSTQRFQFDIDAPTVVKRVSRPYPTEIRFRPAPDRRRRARSGASRVCGDLAHGLKRSMRARGVPELVLLFASFVLVLLAIVLAFY